MKSLGLLLLCIVLVLSFPTGQSKEDARVHKQKLSEKKHYSEDEDHEHDASYDHEAFLGKEGAEEADHLSPEESKEKLGEIFHRIDKKVKEDGFVTEKELHMWITEVQKNRTDADVLQQWNEHKITDNVMKLETYLNKAYGDEKKEDTKAMRDRDEKRWLAADANKDGHLDITEFKGFLHPEEVEHLKEIVIDETLEDMDKDKDKMISLEEYMANIFGSGSPTTEEEEQGNTLEWRKEEEEYFKKYDENNDGFLSGTEIRMWQYPEAEEALDESKHLMEVADKNKDQKLTKEEILDNHELFIGSQVADFGAVLDHEEL